MKRLATGVTAAALLASAVPVLAQGGAPAQSPAGTAPPASTPPAGATQPPPTVNAPPVASPTPPETTTPVEAPPAVNQPVQQAAPPPAAITIAPDAAYPNGFQDPADPFANSVRADNDRDGGFPWGLLGLLGLLGLVPLIRGRGPRTVYVEREEPRRRDVGGPGRD